MKMFMFPLNSNMMMRSFAFKNWSFAVPGR